VPLRNFDGIFARWFSEKDSAWALQRPDFYLYGTAVDQAGAVELLRDLRRNLALD
jgi:hypothetical protein